MRQNPVLAIADVTDLDAVHGCRAACGRGFSPDFMQNEVWSTSRLHREHMQRRYVTVDVFSDRAFGGNPLAVVLDAQGLHTAAMQAIAAEFNYSETTFVLPPRDPASTAHVRIFTPRTEVPFAGHPNVGTAVVLARELEASGSPAPERMSFEERAGPVALRLLRGEGRVIGAELAAPAALSLGAAVTADEAAACLSIEPHEIVVSTHGPRVLSVGLPFLITEVGSRAATIEWRVEQGVDMGRPSVIRGRTEKHDGDVAAVYIAGSAVPVMRGSLDVF
jgi:predicted PhzF superfamily epimerase YddE/YHI9